jgi:hypothetical protein
MAIRVGPNGRSAAAPHAEQACRRWELSRKLVLALVVLAAGAAATFPAHTPAAASAIEPETLTRARVIRAEITARYRLVPGRKLATTEATTTGIVETVSLVTDWLEPPRVVPADNGIYFAICSVGAICPYPARSAARRAAAFLPRRQALELALRTFLETSASLVVVALPTAEPVWVVFERDDLLMGIDALPVLDRLAGHPAVASAALRDLVGRLTGPRLFVPLPILPPPDDTIYAVRLSERASLSMELIRALPGT